MLRVMYFLVDFFIMKMVLVIEMMVDAMAVMIMVDSMAVMIMAYLLVDVFIVKMVLTIVEKMMFLSKDEMIVVISLDIYRHHKSCSKK